MADPPPAGRWILDQWVPITWRLPELLQWCVTCQQTHPVHRFGWHVHEPGSFAHVCQDGPSTPIVRLEPSAPVVPPVSLLQWCPACQRLHRRTAFGPKATYCRESMNRRSRQRTARLQGAGLTAKGAPRIYRLSSEICKPAKPA